ncbi:MAG: hypothetical protein H6564_20725 [Lewinellaceae bacterium]|nr:hypothetical protein [Lewinellaceae bacterium]
MLIIGPPGFCPISFVHFLGGQKTNQKKAVSGRFLTPNLLKADCQGEATGLSLLLGCNSRDNRPYGFLATIQGEVFFMDYPSIPEVERLPTFVPGGDEEYFFKCDCPASARNHKKFFLQIF